MTSYQVCDFNLPIAADPLLSRGMMGDGVINFPAITRMVTAAGYDGPVEVEIFNADIWAAPADEVVATMTAGKSWCCRGSALGPRETSTALTDILNVEWTRYP